MLTDKREGDIISCMNIAEQLRRALKATGLSILQISKRANVPYQAAHGFVKSDRDIKLTTAVKLAKLAGMELQPVRKRKSR